MFAVLSISNPDHGGSVVAAALSLFVVAFIASMDIWKLQGIHAIRLERSRATDARLRICADTQSARNPRP